MDIEFSPQFMASLSRAEADDPVFAEALRALMALLHQAGAGSVDIGEFMATLERLGCLVEPEEE